MFLIRSGRKRALAQGTLKISVLAALLASCNTTEPAATLSISADFEGASLDSWTLVGGDTIEISIRPDTNFPAGFWFAYQVNGGLGRELVFRVADANSLYGPGTWGTKQPVASSDGGESWTRITGTSLPGGVFTFRHRPGSNIERIALTIPYPLSRWLDYKASIETAPFVDRVEVIGQSLDGNPIHMIEVTDATEPDAGKSLIWAVGRQHPGEPEGSFMMEGFIDWVLGNSSGASELRKRARVMLVPFLNPDGVVRGNQRVNVAGLDINRVWDVPNATSSPTILATTEAILRTRNEGLGVRLLLDFHGAPLSRSNFFFFNREEDVPQALHVEMVELMEASVTVNPDFVPVQSSVGRPVAVGERARNWAFEALGTHGLTVEGSGTDVSYGPFIGQQMTETRYHALGEAVAIAVWEVLYN